MKVHELMRAHVVAVDPDDDLALAAQLMAWNGYRHLPVLSSGRLVGVLSERDVVARRGESGLHVIGTVADAMSSAPDTIHPHADIEDAAARLSTNKVGCLPVVEDDRVVGILTTTDLLAEMAQVRVERVSSGVLLEREAQSVMTSKVAAVFEDDLAVEAAARMHQYGIRHLPVIDGMRRVVGIVSDRDLLPIVGALHQSVRESDAPVSSTRVRDVMTAEPRTVARDASLLDIVGIFAEERFGALPVVDDEGRLQGIVSYVDVLRSLRQVG